MIGKDLLRLNSLKDSKVVAGWKGLNNELTGVNVMEVPDIIDWVKKGEFLITTGYSYKEHPASFAELIPRFVKKGVTALGIKSNRYFGTMPQEILKAADHYNLPIIELDETIVFSSVVRDVMEEIISSEYKALSTVQYRINKLSGILLDGNGIYGVLEQLQNFVKNPVIIVCSDGKNYLCKDDQNYFENLELEQEEDRYKERPQQGWDFFYLQGKQCRYYYYQLRKQYDYNAEIRMIEMNHPSENLDVMLINQITSLIGLELANEKAEAEIELKYADKLYQDWILGNIDSLKSFRMRSELYELKIMEGYAYRVAILRSDKEQTPDQIRPLVRRMRRNIKISQGVFITIVNDSIAFIICTKADANNGTGTDIIILQDIVDKMKNMMPDTGIQLCVGKKSAIPYNLMESYKDARNISYVSSRMNLKKDILFYGDLDVYSLLYLIPEGEELKNYMDMYLVPIIKYDKEHKTNLYETLRVYLENNENAKLTSEILFTHYNTVSYRLDRIAQILNMDIGAPEVQFKVLLGIKLNDMYLTG